MSDSSGEGFWRVGDRAYVAESKESQDDAAVGDIYMVTNIGSGGEPLHFGNVPMADSDIRLLRLAREGELLPIGTKHAEVLADGSLGTHWIVDTEPRPIFRGEHIVIVEPAPVEEDEVMVPRRDVLRFLDLLRQEIEART